MQEGILITHVVVGLLFILFVLVQDKGTGFGSAIGGSGGGGFYASQRGAAKVLHKASIVLATVFLITAVAYILVPGGEPSLDVDAVDANGVPVTNVDENTPGIVTTPVAPGTGTGVELGEINATNVEGNSVNIVSPEAAE